MQVLKTHFSALVAAWLVLQSSAFVTSSRKGSAATFPFQARVATIVGKNCDTLVHQSQNRQRKSISTVQMQGLFGLGGPELAVIAIVGAFVIGPENLGRMAGQLKTSLDDVPDEL